MIRSIWDQLLTRNSFVQNAAYMFSASAFGMIVQFVFAPILSRLYTPETYGLFGIFNSIVVVLGVFATLGYNQAFVLPKSEKLFRGLFNVALRSTIITSILFTLIFGLAWPWINAILSAEKLGTWTILVGPMVFVLAIDRLLIDWSVRIKAFKSQSLISVPVSIGSKSFNVGYNLLVSPLVGGLIITTAITYVSRIWLYLKKVIPNSREFLRQPVDNESITEAKREFKAYPRFVMWSNALNTASTYIPVLALPIFLDSAAAAGLFTYSLMVLDLPARLLGAGVNKVYFQRAAEMERDNPDGLANMTWKLYRGLILIVIGPLILLGILGEPAYAFVFGNEWEMAGLMAAIMTSFYFFKLVSAPVATIFNVKRKERSLFWFQLTLFGLRLVSIVVAGWLTQDLIEMIIWFSVANAIAYFILIIWIFVLLKQHVWRSILFSLTTFAAGTSIVLLIRHFFMN